MIINFIAFFPKLLRKLKKHGSVYGKKQDEASNHQNHLKLNLMKTKTGVLTQLQKSISLTFLFCSFFSSSFMFSQTKEIKVKSKIDRVTVYASSAQIYRTASFTNGPGTFYIVFSNLSQQINEQSLQASGKGNFTILEVKQRIIYPEVQLPEENIIPAKIIRDIVLLEDSLNKIQFDLDDYNTQADVYRLQKRLIENNKMLTGNADTLPEIKDGLSYLKEQLLDIQKKMIEINKTLFKLNRQKEKMSNRLAELKSYNSKKNPIKPENPSGQAVVTIVTNTQITGSIEISYMVNNAGWNCLYDLRAENSDKPLKLIQKANVYQNTGEDWNDVSLNLSTINPNNNNQIPVLPVQYLSYYTNPVSARYFNEKINQAEMPAIASKTRVDDNETSVKDALGSADFMQTVQTLTNVEYKIPLLYTIPSDGQYHMVSVQNINLNADYSYRCVPKSDKQVYLVANITDFENYELLPGNAGIFFNGGFVGTTNINPSQMEDTLTFAMGVDRNIQVERKKLKEENRNALIENNITKTYTFEIILKNNKNTSATILVTDQIPVSNNRSIVVKPLITRGAEVNETTGILTWKIKLNAGENKTLKFSYSVQSNKDKPLANLN
jgi:uncharacterized protein (TIGR02231 family)